ncbi:MAG TPA: RecQ family ATP-dependent DNA helicase, partial [Stenomitos sp.]
MPHAAPASGRLEVATDPALLDLLKRIWGYEAFLPNQAEAVDALMNGRDSLTILPTGGGKSICYQLPALAKPGMAIVISPLVALMKDQVDSLVANGVAAASLNSSMPPDEKRRVVGDLKAGRLKLLYLSPERLAAPDAFELLSQAAISFIAIDEAHCVSQWGHEFRPDYRNLAQLRTWFPQVSMHAFTATATEAVRDDIVAALGLKDPSVVVGSFDRPNLFYRAEFRRDLVGQVRAVLDRHPGEAGILYCIRRADVESLCETLQGLGYKALPYHAGLSAETRREHQEAFSKEEVDLMVATVAFGMGIDRSNVRFVIHTGMPKSIEHYQQEAGRAGRDRLAAECVLFYGAADPMAWRSIQGEPKTPYDQHALDKVREMYRFCRTLTCRHRFLVTYFGEAFEVGSCGACDVCLGEHQVLPDSTVVAQKILSCVARVQERFGARHVAEVLKGSKAAKVLQLGHDRLSTYGLLAEHAINDLADWIDQLVGHGYLVRSGEFQVLKVTPQGWALLKGEDSVQLTMPRATVARTVKGSDEVALSPEEEALFQDLRSWRRTIAHERGVPPYLILGDA